MEAPDATSAGSIADVVAELRRFFAASGREGKEGGREREGGEGERGRGGGRRGEGPGGRGRPSFPYLRRCYRRFMHGVKGQISGAERRCPVESHCTLRCRPNMRKLSDEARAVLRDFVLVFDLDGLLKGSTEITEAEAAQVLEYMTSMFDFAGLPIPTTWMSAKGLTERSKALRSRNQQFKKEHAKFHELIKFAFELCHVNTADGFLPAIAEASVRKPPSYWFPKGRKNLNEKLLKERIETLEKSLAEQEALVAKMTSLREAARKLGFTVVGGTSSEHAINEDYKLVKAKLADAKELVEELKPKADKEGKSHVFDAVYMYFMRRLVNDCSIPPERLCQVVHYVYAALFHKGYAGKVPSAQCVRDWIDDLSCKDMELLTELVKNVSKTRSVHILADSSKRDVERHSIHVTYWDDERDQPVTLMVGLPVVVDASSAALAKLTLTTLLTAGVNFEWSMGSPFS